MTGPYVPVHNGGAPQFEISTTPLPAETLLLRSVRSKLASSSELNSDGEGSILWSRLKTI